MYYRSMDATDFVRIDIEHLSGHVVIELNLHLKVSELEIQVKGKELTWSAKGVRVTIPARAAEMLVAMSKLAHEPVDDVRHER
ncbi:MAG: hypothetical protein WDA16_14395 [Candidatus Thermoplasmatota archaeon]